MGRHGDGGRRGVFPCSPASSGRGDPQRGVPRQERGSRRKTPARRQSRRDGAECGLPRGGGRPGRRPTPDDTRRKLTEAWASCSSGSRNASTASGASPSCSSRRPRRRKDAYCRRGHCQNDLRAIRPACRVRVRGRGRNPEQTSEILVATAVQLGPRLLRLAADLKHFASVRRHRSSFCEASGVPSLGSSCPSRRHLGDWGDRNGYPGSLSVSRRLYPRNGDGRTAHLHPGVVGCTSRCIE